MATKLSQLELSEKQIEEKLRQTGVTLTCPVSGHSQWTIVNDFVSVIPWDGKYIFNNSYPAIMLGCKGCGYMALFSAVVLGLVNPDEESSDE